jgi:hypothetical protein
MGEFGLAVPVLLGPLLLVGSTGRRGEMGKARLPVIQLKSATAWNGEARGGLPSIRPIHLPPRAGTFDPSPIPEGFFMGQA